jgi:hypothetical protein
MKVSSGLNCIRKEKEMIGFVMHCPVYTSQAARNL